MKVNSQLKGAQLEITDSEPTDKSKAKITYNTECGNIQVGDGNETQTVADKRDMPVGSIIMWAAGVQPDSDYWLLCDGTDLPQADHAELFAVLGQTYGGTGANFSLPDYRGEFLRGTDRGANRDPNRATRSNRGDGTTGDVVGTREGFAIQQHTHNYTDIYRSLQNFRRDNANDRAGADIVNSVTRATSGVVSAGSISTETRPRNVNIDFYIKRK